MNHDNETLTLEEAAREYKTSIMTLRRRIKAGMLPASKATGKITLKRKDIENFMKKVPAA